MDLSLGKHDLIKAAKISTTPFNGRFVGTIFVFCNFMAYLYQGESNIHRNHIIGCVMLDRFCHQYYHIKTEGTDVSFAKHNYQMFNARKYKTVRNFAQIVGTV